jgi:hypothetical protein
MSSWRLAGLVIAPLMGLCDAYAMSAAAQPSIQRLSDAKRLWAQGDFAEAYEVLKQYRDTDYGRSFEVDFMLGTSACRLLERRTRGAAFLEWVSYAYSDQLTEEGVSVVAHELSSCRSPVSSTVSPNSPPATGRMVTAGASLSGKTFYWLNRDDRAGITTVLAKAVPLPAERILERRVSLGNGEAAQHIAQTARPGAKIKVFSPFVIVSSSGHSKAQLDEINALLARYLQFFVASYGVQRPQNYIYVYLMPDIKSLERFASRHHGMRLNFGTIAYSFRDDLSIAAVIPGRKYGSLFHELFHLLARSNFGDIPTWLDEGIAALYEVSRADGSGFRGMPNWRGGILARFKEEIPSLSDLIQRRPLALSDAEDQGYLDPQHEGEQAVLSATSRYFALYLQEKNKLFSTYAAVRDFSASESFTGTPSEVVRLIEQTAGASIGDLNAQFRTWLSKVLRLEYRTIGTDQRLKKYIPPRP